MSSDEETAAHQQVSEYQLVRADGTVLTSGVAVDYCASPAAMWSPPMGAGAEPGRCYGRMRALRGGPWKVIACYPEGYWSESFYDETTGQIQVLTAPVLWDMTGKSDFMPFNPADPVEGRGAEVQALRR